MLVPLISFGQDFKISGNVIDGENDKALPFANIMVLNHSIGTSSGFNGEFELVLPDSLRPDSLIITYMGYHKHVLCINDYNEKSIPLNATKFKLPEVFITPSNKKSKPITLHPFKGRKCHMRLYPVADNGDLWIPHRPQEPNIEALYFPYREEYENTRWIKEVQIKVTNLKVPSYFSLRIFNTKDDKSPGIDLLSEPLIIEVNKDNKPIIVNLKKHNLLLPDDGLFVGLELLIIEENKTVFEDTDGSIIIQYSPFLNYYEVIKEQSFWILTKGGWERSIRSIPHFFRKDAVLFLKPAISIVLTD